MKITSINALKEKPLKKKNENSTGSRNRFEIENQKSLIENFARFDFDLDFHLEVYLQKYISHVQ